MAAPIVCVLPPRNHEGEKRMSDIYMCLYCSKEVPDGKICYGCREYKSVMTVADYEDYLGVRYLR